MQYEFEPSKYDYINVRLYIGDARPRNKKIEGLIGPIPSMDSNVEALGFDGWELIYYSEGFVFGTYYIFRREKDVKTRKKWMIDFYREEKGWVEVMSKGRRTAYKHIISKKELQEAKDYE